MTYAKIGQHFAPNEIDSKFVTSVKQLNDFDKNVMEFIKAQMTPCVLLRKNCRWNILSISPLNLLHNTYIESQNIKIEPDTLVYWI